MGITIHYCGKMDDVGQVEILEDQVLDFVHAIGGRATLWRSFDDRDSSRVVRGLMIELEPGQDTFSLLISPEGDLTFTFIHSNLASTPSLSPSLTIAIQGTLLLLEWGRPRVRHIQQGNGIDMNL